MTETAVSDFGNIEMEEKLKPCPFCGGKANVEECDYVIQISCPKCKFTRSFRGLVQSEVNTGVPVRYTGGIISSTEWYDCDAERNAINRWNERVPC